MKITIVGLGLMGGSIARDLAPIRLTNEIWGVEVNEAFQKDALELDLVDRIYSLEEAILSRDLVILALPVNIIQNILPFVLDRVGATTTVVDLGSTKVEIIKSVQNHPKRAHYVSAHPMAGTEHSGPRAAIRGLFKDRITVLCDVQSSGVEHSNKTKKLFQILGSKIVEMGAQEHDLHVAFVSHLSHIISFVLANTVLKKEKNEATIFSLAGGGFESTVRLAKSSPEMWAPIFEQNQTHVLDALKSYIDEIQQFYEHIQHQRFDLITEKIHHANEIRRILPQILPSPSSGEKK